MSVMRNPLIALLGVVMSACSAPTPEAGPGTTASAPTMAACADTEEPPDSDVYAYFHCAGAELDPPRPVGRPAPAADPSSRLEAALRALLAGPTQAEREAGYVSLFSEQTALALTSVELRPDGVAIVDFADLRVVMNNASTSSGSQVLLAQLGATVFQIPEATAVEYRIHGSCSTFWAWLQRACEVVPRP